MVLDRSATTRKGMELGIGKNAAWQTPLRREAVKRIISQQQHRHGAKLSYRLKYILY
jgi:exonuclease V gamma subunit